jgi:hypothetical protein
MGIPNSKVVPIKSGEGRKFTAEGVVQIPKGYLLTSYLYFNNATIQYRPASYQEFVGAAQQARMKLYFRGFPAGTCQDEILLFLQQFGQIEYFYQMGAPKSGKQMKTIQGYIIFDQNEDAFFVLNENNKIMFGHSQIVFQEYQANKKKKQHKRSLKLNQLDSDLNYAQTNYQSIQGDYYTPPLNNKKLEFFKAPQVPLLNQEYLKKKLVSQSTSNLSSKKALLQAVNDCQMTHIGTNLCFVKHSKPMQHLIGGASNTWFTPHNPTRLFQW